MTLRTFTPLALLAAWLVGATGCAASHSNVGIAGQRPRRAVQADGADRHAPAQAMTVGPSFAADRTGSGQVPASRETDTLPPAISLWFELNWDTAKSYDRFAAALQSASRDGVRRMTVSISGDDSRVRDFVNRLLRDVPDARLTITLSTAELMPRLDGAPETWAQMGRLARWCAERTGTGRCVIDFEWSLLPWYEGKAGASLDLRAFRRNARALAAAAGPVEILVYPANYRAVEWKRLVTLAILAAELPRFRQIGTTWHSPHTWRAASATDIRRIDEALSYRPPAEQIILGATWWHPATLSAVLADVSPDREVWLWFQPSSAVISTANPVQETLAVLRAQAAHPK